MSSLTAAPPRIQNESEEMTSPPAQVMSARKTGRATVLRMKRTAPSQKRALNPPVEVAAQCVEQSP